MKAILLHCCLLAFVAIQGFAQSTIFQLTPFNSDTIETKNPLFSWYLSDGSTANERVSYSFVLVEMSINQSADEAVNVNIPVMRVDNLNQTQYMYPNDAPALKENVWYAWQVQKHWANNTIDKSEAWKFIIVQNRDKQKSIKYTKLKKKADAEFYQVREGKVYFAIDEKFEIAGADLKIIDKKDNSVILTHKFDPSGNPNLKLQGNNLYELDLGANLKRGFYRLETIDGRGKKYMLELHVDE